MQNNSKVLNTIQTARELIAHILSNQEVLPVFDLDGVLLDASHRIQLRKDGSLDLDQYRADSTLENILRDKNLPLMEVIHTLNMIGRPYHVATARVLCEGSKTLLKQRHIRPVKVISRQGEADHRKDWCLKLEGVHEQFDPSEFKRILLIDDCQDNCDAFINALGAWAINVDIKNSPKESGKWLQDLL